MGYYTNVTIKDVEHLRAALNELNYHGGIDRAAILLFGGSSLAPTPDLFFLVCTDPDGEWFFLTDPGEGKWRHLSLDALPSFTGSFLVAGQS